MTITIRFDVMRTLWLMLAVVSLATFGAMVLDGTWIAFNMLFVATVCLATETDEARALPA